MSNPKLSLLPPAPDKCQICAVKHPPEQPHDATSLYFAFYQQSIGKPATWAEAITHCSPVVKACWTAHLRNLGIDITSPKTRGDIKTQEELEQRLAGGDHD